MPSSGKCCVVGCNTRLQDKKRTYVIPSKTDRRGRVDPLKSERRQKWLEAIRRSPSTLKNARVCSSHFISTRPVDDRDHPDWAPSVAMGYDTLCESPRTRFATHSTTKEDERQPIQDYEKKQYLAAQTHISQLLMKSMEDVKDTTLQFCTGLPRELCKILIEKVEPHLNPCSLTVVQQFFICAMKLRHNFLYTDLAIRFNTSRYTVSRVFHKWVDILYAKLKIFVEWPDREELQCNVPSCFQESFGKRITVIIDCFEVFTQRSSNPNELVSTWSNYKHHNTIKYLIGITPHGKISFISKGYVGRTSDTGLTESCGILEKLLPGDVVMCDRGFHIQQSLQLHFAEVCHPSFVRGRKQLSPMDIEKSRKISNVRIHVERVIGHVRGSFKIMDGQFTMLMLREVDTYERGTYDKIAVVCCALINLNQKIV